jgi:CRISPR-associated endonuclease/helicase Cas3
LILSHHSLPNLQGADPLAFADLYAVLDVYWTAFKPEVDAVGCWNFKHGAPDRSATWRVAAAGLAKQLLNQRKSLVSHNWSVDPYALQLGRMSLVLGDHHYSSLKADPSLQGSNYPVFANTDRDTGARKQKLDEHLIGVERVTKSICAALPKLNAELPRLARHKGLTRRTANPSFSWQNDAFELTRRCRVQSAGLGFFGVNLASTGCGKTLANARIMYALAEPNLGARFSIALGLRTLTLQTGTALRERLGLSSDEMAVLVGSAAVRELYSLQQSEKQQLEQGRKVLGSASADALISEDAHVLYEGAISESNLQHWLDGARGNTNKLVQAPILVCTIDHLIQASESTRSGHHIAPMLRLLTSDLVLDEPDDFDLADLPALSRFVYTAGLLGSRLLLSSATLPPALVQGLFEAYRAGRASFQRHRGMPGLAANICCAWFDEFGCVRAMHGDEIGFAGAHESFVAKRLSKLAQLGAKRLGNIENVNSIPLKADHEKPEHTAAIRGFAITAIAVNKGSASG